MKPSRTVNPRAKQSSVKSADGELTQAEELQRMAKELAAWEIKGKLQELRIKQLEKENASYRAQRDREDGFLQTKIRKLELDIAELREKLEAANKQLAWFRKSEFHKTSEQGAGQENKGPQESPNKKTRKRNPNQPEGNPRSDRSQLDTTIEFIPDDGQCCPTCGLKFRLLESVEQSPLTEIEINLLRTIFLRRKYVSRCECQGKKIYVVPPPAKLFPKTEIGSSLWIRLVVQKFLHGVPVNRTLKELELMGLHLAAGTVAGGFRIIDQLIEPLYTTFLKRCQGADLWNADETTWRVFGSEKQKWWFWLVASDDTVVYVLDSSRSSKVPAEFFAGSAGILMTDRFSSYKALHAAIKKVWCWVHARRDFLKIFEGMPSLRPWARGWLQIIAELFVLEHKRFALWKAGVTSGEAWNKVEIALTRQIENIKTKWETELKRPKLHKEQGKALRSMKRHWSGLTAFLADPRIPLHNNRAERLLRNAVILRKNSFGSGSEWSGHMSAKVFTIFQTWLINGLDPQALLLDYFHECSKTPGKPPPTFDGFLPWMMSETRRKQFALPDSYKRPG